MGCLEKGWIVFLCNLFFWGHRLEEVEDGKFIGAINIASCGHCVSLVMVA